MLCSKRGCSKKIPLGEEVQIEGSIICKECSEKPIAYCFTCSPEKSLYNNDRIHEISRNWGRDFNIWVLLLNVKRSESEKVTQCDQCYQEWKKEQKKDKKKWWNKKEAKELLSILLIISLVSAFYLFYPDKFERLEKEWVITIVFISCLFAFLSLLLKFLFGEDDRFKTRKKRKQVIPKKRKLKQ